MTQKSSFHSGDVFGEEGNSIQALPFSSRTSGNIVADIKEILAIARRHVAVQVNVAMLYAYWLIGRRIVEEEQKGEGRALYGEHLLERLSRELSGELGNGFTEANLRNFRIFYRTYPSEEEIRYTLCIKLSWSHHRLIMRVPAKEARLFYLKEASEQQWSVRTLERNINTRVYDRLMTKSEGAVEQNKRAFSPEKYLKDPYVFEFLNIRDKKELKGKEKKVEEMLISNLQDFLMELGKGFCFVGRQYRISTETEHFYIDLVFYNCILKCYVLFDLKTGKLTHQDIGQMDMYRRMFDNLKCTEGDQPTIGVLLCAERDETVVKYSILKDCEKIFAAKFLPYLPSEEELISEIETKRAYFQEQLDEDNLELRT